MAVFSKFYAVALLSVEIEQCPYLMVNHCLEIVLFTIVKNLKLKAKTISNSRTNHQGTNYTRSGYQGRKR